MSIAPIYLIVFPLALVAFYRAAIRTNKHVGYAWLAAFFWPVMVVVAIVMLIDTALKTALTDNKEKN